MRQSQLMIDLDVLNAAIKQNVDAALAEDIGTGDISAQLIPLDTTARAKIYSRQEATLCGTPWVDEIFRRLDPNIAISWQVEEGQQVAKDQCLVEIAGNARALLSGERTALNFLQTLSGVATVCRHYAGLVSSTKVKLLDTRKTLPGLRIAEKYAVTIGGCFNHRIGLYDAFLIKENHINACGSIAATVRAARELAPGKSVEVEVENLNELEQALEAKADIIMLDNFSVDDMRVAVKRTNKQAKIEASGGINEQTLLSIAKTGVDYISIGTITKDCKAVDLSMRFV
tara:strand:+ start:22160 stop:23017 length:858 start_codon:yes stop_codon:yes gene_type:complete